MGERLAESPVKRAKRGGAIVLAVVLLGAFAIGWFVWAKGGEDAQMPTKEQVTRPGGTKWLVKAETLRTSQGFEVVPLDASDLREEPRLDDLVNTDGDSTVILTGAELDALTGYLATQLPDGWDDPFDYGIAWRYGNVVVHLSVSQADVL